MATNGNRQSMDNVIDAMRTFQSQGDSWKVADALAARIPDGESGFDEIMTVAESAHVLGSFKKNSLIQYRNAANRWPENHRVKGVSFTAHREIMAIKDDKGQEMSRFEHSKLLKQLAEKQGGPDKVTTKVIRDLIRANAGHKPRTRAQTTAVAVPQFDVLADIKKGGDQLIEAIGKDTSDRDLTRIVNGLKKVLAHAENLRTSKAEAAKRAAAKEARAAAPAPTKPANGGNGAAAPAAMARKRRGNVGGY